MDNLGGGVHPYSSKKSNKKKYSFIQSKICSSQDPDHGDSKINKKLGSCSLGRSCSPAYLGSGHKKKSRSANYWDRSLESRGLSNFDATAKSIEDIELDSDGEAPCFNMAIFFL